MFEFVLMYALIILTALIMAGPTLWRDYQERKKRRR